MKRYVLKLHMPPSGTPAVAAAGDRVRWVRSVYLPEEETCVLVFEAASRDAVERAIVEGHPGTSNATDRSSDVR